MNLTNAMRPIFWKRFNLFNAIRRNLRENIYISAANSQIYSRDLVQRTLTQFIVYNDEHNSIFTRPTLDLYYCNKYWSYLTKNMS